MAKRKQAGRGKTARKTAELAGRNQLLLDRWVSGTTQTALAVEFKLSQGAIARACKSALDQFKTERFEHVEEIKVLHSARLEAVFFAAMEQFERSKKNRASVTITTRDGVEETSKKSEGQCGDPRYLREAREALADIRKIWGANAEVAPAGNTFNQQINVVQHAASQELTDDQLTCIAAGSGKGTSAAPPG